MKNLSKRTRVLTSGIIFLFVAYALLVLWNYIIPILLLPIVIEAAFCLYLIFEKRDTTKNKIWCLVTTLPFAIMGLVPFIRANTKLF